MSKIALVLRAACLLTSLFSPLRAYAEIHGTLTFTTNNVSRWFSKTNNSVAVQANLEYQHTSGLYLGTSAANVDFSSATHPDSAQVEITPYLGWNFTLSDQWRTEIQWSRYLYDSNVFGHDADYNEFYLFLHYKDLLTAHISVTDNFYNVGNYAINYELSGKYPITNTLEFSATAGYNQTQAALGSDYPYWNIGLSYYYKFLVFDLRYVDAIETAIQPAIEQLLHERYDAPQLNASAVFSVSIGF
jgi:uncharacterized protein (TIGR02001 family)